MVLPPHSTHSLQPLDVVLFSPLSKEYSAELIRYFHRSQGLVPVRKGDFFPIFWHAWSTSFTSEIIIKAFEATGVMPGYAEVVLQRFKTPTPQRDTSPKIESQGDGSSWRQLRNLFESAVKDARDSTSKALSQSLHSMQVNNDLLHHENDLLKDAPRSKRKHKAKSKSLDLHQRKEYHSKAVFYSPHKIREGLVRDEVKQREDDAAKLQKVTRESLRRQLRCIKRIGCLRQRQLRPYSFPSGTAQPCSHLFLSLSMHRSL
jgi:hypothetical protein